LLLHTTNEHKCLISSGNKHGSYDHHTRYFAICGVTEDHDTGYKDCPTIVEAKTIAKECKETAYRTQMAKQALLNTGLTDDMVY
jgi:hypothetical protein